MSDNINQKLDKLDSRLDSVDKTLVAQHEQLKLHIYRTELAEKRIQHIEANLEPVKIHVNRMDGALKLVGTLGLILGVISGFLRLFNII
jgi:hypothetical protein